MLLAHAVINRTIIKPFRHPEQTSLPSARQTQTASQPRPMTNSETSTKFKWVQETVLLPPWEEWLASGGCTRGTCYWIDCNLLCWGNAGHRNSKLSEFIEHMFSLSVLYSFINVCWQKSQMNNYIWKHNLACFFKAYCVHCPLSTFSSNNKWTPVCIDAGTILLKCKSSQQFNDNWTTQYTIQAWNYTVHTAPVDLPTNKLPMAINKTTPTQYLSAIRTRIVAQISSVL